MTDNDDWTWRDDCWGRMTYAESLDSIKAGHFRSTHPWCLDRFVIYRRTFEGEYNRPIRFVPKGHVLIEGYRYSDGVSLIEDLVTMEEYATFEPLFDNGIPRVLPKGYTPKNNYYWKDFIPKGHRLREVLVWHWELEEE